MLALYYLLPARRGSIGDDSLRLAVGQIVVIVFLVWQTTRVVKADLPELRAAQTLGALIPLFLVVFASIYLSLGRSSSSSFSQPLDHSSAFYFTVTVFSTVGFGDIVPRTDAARTVVSIQMLLDLVIIGVVVRILISAARIGLARSNEASSDQP